MGARAVMTTREITPEECPWLDEAIPADELLYICNQATYGCVSPWGAAITRDPDGGYPFFELPTGALRKVGLD